MKEEFIPDFPKGRESMELKGIEVIENSKIGEIDKAELLLVFLGEKDGYWHPVVDTFPTNDLKKREETRNRIDKVKKEFLEILKNMQVYYHLEEFETETEEGKVKMGFNFFVSSDRERMENLKEAHKNQNSLEIGLALGYPKTAVEGYLEDDIFDTEEYLTSLSKEEREKMEEQLKFRFFALSKKNWRKELELVKKYQEVVRNKSPKIYQEIISQED